MNGASQAGGAQAETTTGLTLVEARAKGFPSSLVSVAAVGDGGAVVLGCMALHHNRNLIVGRVFGLDDRAQPRSTFGDRLNFASCNELMLAATPTRTALLHRSNGFGIGALMLLSARGKDDGPNIVGPTALSLAEDDQPWLAHRPPSPPQRGTLVSRVKDGWPTKVVELQRLEGEGDGPRVLAMRAQPNGSGVVVATTSSAKLFRAEFSALGVQNQVTLAGEGEVSAAGIDASGRIVVYRPSAEHPWARYLSDGTVDAAFGAPPDLRAAALAVADDGSTWVVVRRTPPASDAVLRLTPEGKLDPAVSFEVDERHPR